MQVTMQHGERLTLAGMREFLSASNNLSFAVRTGLSRTSPRTW